MKKLQLELCLFSLIMMGIFQCVAVYTDRRLLNCDKGRMSTWYDISHGQVNADALIMGNSHARVQIDPRILDSAFPGRHFFNMGMDGFYFDVQLARYRFYCRYNRPPKYIFICADYFNFNHSEGRLSRSQFMPFLYDTAISRVVGSLGMGSIDRSIPFLKYRGEGHTVSSAIKGESPIYMDEPVKREWKGFFPTYRHWDEATFNRDTLEYRHFGIEVDSAVWHSFAGFLAECRQQHITVYVVFTPHQWRFASRVRGAIAYRAWLGNAVKSAGAEFLDFSNAGFCADTALFYNGTHVNPKGARIFSMSLCDSLRKMAFGRAGNH